MRSCVDQFLRLEEAADDDADDDEDGRGAGNDGKYDNSGEYCTAEAAPAAALFATCSAAATVLLAASDDGPTSVIAAPWKIAA